MFYTVLLALVLLLLYWYGTRNYNYWKVRGIKYENPVPFFGNYFKHFIQKASIGQTVAEVYKNHPDEKVVGIFRTTKPELVVRDPDIIKRILVTDSQYFYGRGFNPHKTVIEPLMKNLFFADGDLWKLLRQRFTPAFTSGKLKAMFPLIVERAEKLQLVAERATAKDSCDVRELMARYTTDFIGACGFGINSDSLDDENSEFRKLGKRMFQRHTKDACRALLKIIFPETFKHLTFLAPEIEENMNGLVQSVIKERNYEPSGRNDFIDQLLVLKKQGKIIGESIESRNSDGTPKVIEMDFNDALLTAQVFVFFAAGYETSSLISGFTLHQLAFHPEYQEKVQKEIDEVLMKYDNKLTYDAVKEMTCLEKAFNESMRIYPSVGYLVRKCAAKEYTIPEINLTLTEDVIVTISTQAIQNDPKYFINPDKFDPERFNDGANKDYVRKFIYLPFGEGPRSCVGERLGQMQSMAGIAAVLQKFTVEPASNTLRYPVPDPTGIVSENFIGGLPLKIRRRTINA